MSEVKASYRVFDDKMEYKVGDLVLNSDKVFDGDYFDESLWNTVFDLVDPPHDTRFVVTLQYGDRVYTMEHTLDEGWLTYGEDPEFGLWDYSGDRPRRIKKIGE